MTANPRSWMEQGVGGLVPRGYVEDEGRPLGDALQGESSNRPKRLEHNGFGRERWGKGIVEMSGGNPEGER